MTILWIYDMPLIPEAGGTERITSLVAKGLSALGHNCKGILVFERGKDTMTYGGTRVDDLYNFLKENHVDIIINQIAYDPWLLTDFLARGGKRWHMEGGIIISCLHFDPRPTSNLYYFLSKRHKSIRDRFNITKAFLLYNFYNRQQEIKTGRIFNWIYDNSDWYITLSPSHFPYFRQVTARKEYHKLRAINNPLTFDDISSPSIIEEKRKVILVCSRMDEYQKRISLVLKAWKRICRNPLSEGWTLKILGSGQDLDKYKDYALRHNLDNIYFEGQQSPEPYYRQADIFLMTSKGIEGWGLTLTESLQRGVVPVVMNTCSVYRDIITDGYNGYLTPGSRMRPFVERILTLISDPVRLRAMQLNALNSANRFTITKTMEKWEEVIYHHVK